MVETLAPSHERIIPRAGDVFASRYLVERMLGKGGMGAVLAARDLWADRLVAIKFLLPGCDEDEQLVVRFEREARATERLRNEHVCRVLESGVDAVGRRYLVMEHLDGQDLRAVVKREGPLEPARAADYVAQACHALAEAHALGIVHRDLKPANLFLARRADGSSIIKVVDFGVAKFDSPNVAGDERDMTAPQMVLGSRSFMAPEQILAPRGVDALADVWALGAILYYLLTAQTPFAAPTLEELTLNLLCEPPHPILELRPGLSPHLVAVVERCLSRDRGQRYPNVIELMRALDPLGRPPVSEQPVGGSRGALIRTLNLGDVQLPPAPQVASAPPAPPEPPAPPTPQIVVHVTTRPLGASPPRPSGMIPFFVGACAAGLLIGVLLAGRLPPPPAQSPAPPAPAATEARTAIPEAPAALRPAPGPVTNVAAPTVSAEPQPVTSVRPFAAAPPPPVTRPASRTPSPSAVPVAGPGPAPAPTTSAAPHRVFSVEE